MKKIRVGILGATGMVGQRFIILLNHHPWFEVVAVAASPASAGKKYQDTVSNRWYMPSAIPSEIKKMKVYAVENDMSKIIKNVNMVFSALDLDKDKIRQIENAYAEDDIAVISSNSAHRWTADVPLIIPEVNPHHVRLIDIQRRNRGWKKGLIAVKPNCSIQSYVTILTALKQYQPQKIVVTSLQSISGAGKVFATWPEMVDNVIPYISGEEEKSELEPMKIWGELKEGKIEMATLPTISATCIRIPVTDGHMVSINCAFAKKPTKEEILAAIKNYPNPLNDLDLPSKPTQFIKYFDEEDRPQTKLDRDFGNGMGITMGRLRQDNLLDWKFVALSHNTIRGAAGGAILLAELLYQKGYLN